MKIWPVFFYVAFLEGGMSSLLSKLFGKALEAAIHGNTASYMITSSIRTAPGITKGALRPWTASERGEGDGESIE